MAELSAPSSSRAPFVFFAQSASPPQVALSTPSGSRAPFAFFAQSGSPLDVALFAPSSFCPRPAVLFVAAQAHGGEVR